MTDGRNQRGAHTRQIILIECRAAMKAGVFRPTMSDVTKAAKVSVRSGFQHYSCTDELWVAALANDETRQAILGHILKDSLPPASEADCRRLVNAAVFGRVM